MPPANTESEDRSGPGGALFPPLTATSRSDSPGPSGQFPPVGPFSTATSWPPPLQRDPTAPELSDPEQSDSTLPPWLSPLSTEAAPADAFVSVDLEPEAGATSSDGHETKIELEPAFADDDFQAPDGPGEAIVTFADEWQGLGASGEPEPKLPLQEQVADHAATWEFEEELLTLGAAHPEDELSAFPEPASLAPGSVAVPADRAIEAAFADRLERIANTLREQGLDGALRAYPSDPLAAIVCAYLSGSLESRER